MPVDRAHVGDDQAVDALAAHEVHEGARPLELFVRRFEQHLVALPVAAVVDGAQEARQVGVVKQVVGRGDDDGDGAPEVATDLEIRFQDGTYFVRAEYDGSEWWDAVIPRVNPESSTKPITRLTVTPREIGRVTLAEMAKADGAEVER